MIRDRRITITLNGNLELFKRLSINEWNALITSYENDPNAEIEPYDEGKDGWCIIHTTLSNVVDNHSVLDLRFASWISEE